ncbi:protein SIEVE ELEMENT OCCLUSION B-like isoform X3 [Lotus japonicus]|nr:protein SIEVE ELEMENT OCCLUSION B-like isoform X3 [Lotus japonicus]XP_057429721.1 protein SIEVE ELEMENT OCCLUSION B-like isoform X3 [Lotus japonicus]
MICTARGDHYAHHTTMLILEQLKSYSWDAKALIVQAAFALEYGKFLFLPQIPKYPVERSLAELNGLLLIHQNTQHLIYFSSVVKKVMQVIECITEWKRLTSAGYDIKDVPALSDTLHEIPVVVYWAIFTFVTCTGQLDDFTTDNKGQRHELSKNFENKLDIILRSFKEHLEECSKQIGAIEDYTRRRNIVIHTGKDIVKVLKALIVSGDNRESRQLVHNGLTGEQVRIEEFKKKHVLLFISGLENIEDETQLLRSIFEKLKDNPKEVEGYRKDDFKILWIPIVDEWNDRYKKMLESHLQRTKIGWYVVKDFHFPTGIKLIREVFNYKDRAVIPLISPEGKVENIDTKNIISVWGIDGFPFRTSDHTRLTQQWNWFWAEMTKLNPKIGDLIEEDCYLFIYGGTDSKWMQEITSAVETMKRQIETVLQLDITIEPYPLGKDDPKVVPRFWIAIDSLFASRKQKKGGDQGVQDFATREIKRLLFLKQDPKGWVILSRGSNVKLLGQGEAMYHTVKDFEIWHGKLHQDVSFDVAFKEYYEGIKAKKIGQKCEHSEIADYPTDILARINCPNMDCGRSMEVTSVNYRCCHGHEP